MTRAAYTDYLLNLGAEEIPGTPCDYRFPAFSLAITITATGAYTSLGAITFFTEENNDGT